MESAPNHRIPLQLGPTCPEVLDPTACPYFLWWTDMTVAGFREKLLSSDLEERAYWLGALLREANTRDVWVFVTPHEIRAIWPALSRHLGRTRKMWAYLLEMPASAWPPEEAYHGG